VKYRSVQVCGKQFQTLMTLSVKKTLDFLLRNLTDLLARHKSHSFWGIGSRRGCREQRARVARVCIGCVETAEAHSSRHCTADKRAATRLRRYCLATGFCCYCCCCCCRRWRCNWRNLLVVMVTMNIYETGTLSVCLFSTPIWWLRPWLHVK